MGRWRRACRRWRARGDGGEEGASADGTNAAAEAVDVIHSMATAMNAAHIGLNEEHRELLQRALFKHLEHGKSGTRKRRRSARRSWRRGWMATR